MSPSSEDNGRPNAPADSPAESSGVLSNLPRTRPQRSSARRVAAREAASTNGRVERTGTPTPSPPPKKPVGVGSREKTSAAPRGPKVGPKVGPKAGAASKRPARRVPPGASARKAVGDPVPAQGFECDGDRASGPVQPPGSSELAASAVELLGELAKAGISRGEHLLKDVLGRLPLS